MYTQFSAKDIRAKARETMAHTPGIYTLALIPALLTLAVALVQQAQPAIDYLKLQYMSTNDLIHFTFNQTAFPFVFSIIIAFLSLSTLLTMKKVIDHQQETVTFTHALLIFSHPDFGKILSTYLWKAIYLILFGIMHFIGTVLLISGFILLLAGVSVSEDIAQALLLVGFFFFLGGLILSVGGIALYLPQVYAYSLVELLLYEKLENGTYLSARALLKESRHLMKGYKKKRFLLDLSFIGWYILTILSFGLAYVYTLPYYQAASIHFYTLLKENREQLGLR